jgi:hypothetical protein
MSKELKKTIVHTAIYYGRNIDEQVLEMMADDLSDLDPAKCIASYQTWRRNPKNKTFPLPAQIRELVNPQAYITPEAKAREIAARIVGAIPKYGWNNSREAQLYIGPEGWECVRRSGGWTHLCENVGVRIQATTLQAQLRDQLEGVFTYGRAAIADAIGEGKREEPRGLEQAGAVVRQILSRGESEEGGAK